MQYPRTGSNIINQRWWDFWVPWSHGFVLGLPLRSGFSLLLFRECKWTIFIGHERRSTFMLECTPQTTLYILFSVIHYLELHIPISFYSHLYFFCQVKMLMFYNIQTTNSTFVGKKNETYSKNIIVFSNFKL